MELHISTKSSNSVDWGIQFKSAHVASYFLSVLKSVFHHFNNKSVYAV